MNSFILKILFRNKYEIQLINISWNQQNTTSQYYFPSLLFESILPDILMYVKNFRYIFVWPFKAYGRKYNGIYNGIVDVDR